MPRISHGDIITLEQVQSAIEDINWINASGGASRTTPPVLTRFNYMFPSLQKNPAHQHKTSPQTVNYLIELGKTMLDPGTERDPRTDQPLDSDIPSAYTYFAQFVDHDITLEAVTKDVKLDSSLKPWSLKKVLRKIKNTRKATLDLDSVYEPAFYKGKYYPVPRDGDKMVIGRAVTSGPVPNPPGTDINDSDLAREDPHPENPSLDRAAKIGDGRNDENLIISQLHLAFLRAHNAIVDQHYNFKGARKLLRRHYQWIVIHDFLKRIADPKIVNGFLSGSTKKIYVPADKDFFLPLEFTVAAYRFGHSMIRQTYNYNISQDKVEISDLFMPQAMDEYTGILPSWIIQWKGFVEGGVNVARLINTQLSNALFSVPNAPGTSIPNEANLAVRDLLRGYLLRIPTGQSVAQALNLPVLSPADIQDVAANDKQLEVLRGDSGFLERTPLWFYILAEAARWGNGRLGPVGSTIVASVLIELVLRSPDSFLKKPKWSPTLGKTEGQFNLSDLLHLAKVLQPSELIPKGENHVS